MIIKRFTSGDFVELYPKTRAQQVFSNSDVAVFDENNKIKEAFLPNSVFDSLYIFGTVGAGTTQLRELGLEAVADALAENRSAIGYYWVATANAVISGVPGGQGTVTVNGIVASTAGVNPSEEGVASNVGVAIETGDWFILTRITGAGTVEDPYGFTFATVNNTYETASATVHGIVKLGFTSSTANREYKVQTTTDGLFVNVPEVTLAVGQTPGFSGLISLDDKARLDAIEDGAQVNVATNIAQGTRTGTTVPITSSTGTDATLDIATSALAGVMSAADKARLDDIEDGAQANVATNLGYTTAATQGTVTSSTGDNATLPAATTSLAGLMTKDDKTKLDGIAAGATANSTDATLLARGNHTGTQTASTISDFNTAVAANSAVTANTAKITNADHTGDVTGATQLTIGDSKVITSKIAAEAVSNDKLAKMPKFTVKGNNLGANPTAAALDLTTAQLRNITNTVALFFQSTAPTAHEDGVTIQEGTLWFQIPAA